jgi:protein-disulfide isomerase
MVAILTALLVGLASLEGALIESKDASVSLLPPVASAATEQQPGAANSTPSPGGSSFGEVQNLMLGPEEDIPVGDQDAVKGPSGAPIQIVVFSDFQCPACRNYAPQLGELAAQYGDKIQLVFKNFPLDRACNPVVDRDMHIRACEAAYAAEAALKQGKFWNYHDALFGSDLLANPDIFRSLAGSLGMNLQQFEQDRQDQATKAKVRADIDLGIRVGVNATPSLYLNKRRILDVRPDVVRYLIDQTLKAH